MKDQELEHPEEGAAYLQPKEDNQESEARKKELPDGYAIRECHACGEEYIAELCNVAGCNNESTSGGAAWLETGYWRLCYDHYKKGRDGEPQPEMRQSAIEKEATRDKVTGVLPPGELHKGLEAFKTYSLSIEEIKDIWEAGQSEVQPGNKPCDCLSCEKAFKRYLKVKFGIESSK